MKLPPVQAVRISDDRTLVSITYTEPLPETFHDEGFSIVPGPVHDWMARIGALRTVMLITVFVLASMQAAMATGIGQLYGVLIAAMILAFETYGVVGYRRLGLGQDRDRAVPDH